MKRSLLRAAVAVLAVLALFLWRREVATPERALEPARPAVVVAGTEAIDLAAPSSTPRGEARTEIAEAPTPLPAATAAAPAWTGVRVRVTAVEDGRPLAGVGIGATASDGSSATIEIEGSHARIGERPKTGTDGIAELELEAGRPYRIVAWSTVTSARRETLELDRPLASGEIRTLAVALRTQVDIELHGRVTDRDTGAPIAGARIGGRDGWEWSAPEDSAITDADGRFHVAGRSWIRAISHVTAAGYERAWFELAAGRATTADALEITLSRVATVRVTVRDAAGAPIEGLRALLSAPESSLARPQGIFTLSTPRGDATFGATTDARGIAVIPDVPPRIVLAGVLRSGVVELLHAPEPVVLLPGETRDLEWRVGAGCTIVGVAFESDGRPSAGLVVGLESARNYPRPGYLRSTDIEPRRVTKTDDAGRFEFADVGPGPWRVGPEPKKRERTPTVKADDAASHAQLVVVVAGVPRVDVEIRVHRGLTIEGRVVEPNGNPVTRALVVSTHPSEGLAVYATFNDPEGRFVLGPLEAGEYEMRANSPGAFASSDAVLARTGDKDVVLRLRAGAKLRGIVVEKGSSTPVDSDVEVHARLPLEARYSRPAAGRKGSFEFEGLSPGVYDITASTPNGFAGLLRGVELTVGATQDVRVELERGARVRIRFDGPWNACALTVLADDAPVVADWIERGTESAFVLPAGALVVRVRDTGGNADFDLPLTLKVGETRDLVFDGAWK